MDKQADDEYGYPWPCKACGRSFTPKLFKFKNGHRYAVVCESCVWQRLVKMAEENSDLDSLEHNEH